MIVTLVGSAPDAISGQKNIDYRPAIGGVGTDELPCTHVCTQIYKVLKAIASGPCLVLHVSGIASRKRRGLLEIKCESY